jgi:MFS family permease
MKRKILLAIITIILLNSCLIGFNIKMIPIIIMQLSKTFKPYKISLEHTAIGFVLIALLIGIMIVSFLLEKLGRKKSLLILVGSIMLSLIFGDISKNFEVFLIFRFIIWIIIGAISIVIPLLIVEISTAKIRGSILILNQINIILAIYISILFNHFFLFTFNTIPFPLTWIEYICTFILFIFIYKIPESPLWLCLNNEVGEAKKSLHTIGTVNPEAELKSILNYIHFTENAKKAKFFSKCNFKSLKIATLLIIFYQLSGFCLILYYAPFVFNIAGIQDNSGVLLYSSIIFTHLLFTLASMFLIDVIGRRILLMIGSIGMFFFLIMLSKTFFLGNFNEFAGLGTIIYILGFIAFFSFSLGSIIWVIISEIFPFKLRAKGQVYGSFLYWIMLSVSNAIIHYILIHPSINAGGPLFAFSSIIVVAHFFFAWKKIPNTERKTLETIQIQLNKN